MKPMDALRELYAVQRLHLLAAEPGGENLHREYLVRRARFSTASPTKHRGPSGPLTTSPTSTATPANS